MRPPRGTATLGFAFGVCSAGGMPGPILIALLERLGMGGSAARQLLTRLRRRGWVTTERAGRVAVYRLAGPMLRRFDSIRMGEQPAPAWHGSFWQVLYDLPESRRTERDRLRAAAFEVGFAAPRPGVLLGFEEPAFVADFVGLRGPDVLIETGRWAVAPADAARIAEAAWQLPAYRAAADEAHARVREQAAEASDGWAALRALHDAFELAVPVWLTLPRVPTELIEHDLGAGRLSREVTAISARLGPTIIGSLEPWLAGHELAGLLDQVPSEEGQRW